MSVGFQFFLASGGLPLRPTTGGQCCNARAWCGRWERGWRAKEMVVCTPPGIGGQASVATGFCEVAWSVDWCGTRLSDASCIGSSTGSPFGMTGQCVFPNIRLPAGFPARIQVGIEDRRPWEIARWAVGSELQNSPSAVDACTSAANNQFAFCRAASGFAFSRCGVLSGTSPTPPFVGGYRN